MSNKILLVDKPRDWTSFDVVAKIRGTLRQQIEVRGSKENLQPPVHAPKRVKVGHAGTLDPFATGLLIILIGEECKKADEYLKKDKTYQFRAKLGEVSTTGDPEGEKTKTGDRRLGIEEIQVVLKEFIGEIEQIPPAFSAIKVNGKRAYNLARAGKEVKLEPRRVTIYNLKLVEYDYPYLKCECEVSSGTYIRSLVEDIGKQLDVGAYCAELRRTKIGEFDIKNAQSIEQLIKNLN